MPVYDALGDRPGLRVVTSRHETAAVFAAMGFARATGRPAAVLATSGPGFTNALTGMAAAYCEGLPVIVITGNVSTKTSGGSRCKTGLRRRSTCSRWHAPSLAGRRASSNQRPSRRSCIARSTRQRPCAVVQCSCRCPSTCRAPRTKRRTFGYRTPCAIAASVMDARRRRDARFRTQAGDHPRQWCALAGGHRHDARSRTTNGSNGVLDGAREGSVPRTPSKLSGRARVRWSRERAELPAASRPHARDWIALG